MLRLGLGLPLGWVGVPRAGPSGLVCTGLRASSPCFIPGCWVSGGEEGGKAAGDGVDHGLPVAQVQWGCGHRGTLAEGWQESPRLPVPFPSLGECTGDPASAWHVCREGRTSWLVLAAPSQLLLRQVLMLADGDRAGFLHRQLPFLASLERKDGKATAYVCSNFACSLPVTSPQELRGMLCP